MQPNGQDKKGFSYLPVAGFAISGDDHNRTVGDRVANLTQQEEDRLAAQRLQEQFDTEAQRTKSTQETADENLARQIQELELETSRSRALPNKERRNYNNPVDLFDYIAQDMFDQKYNDLQKEEKLLCLDMAKAQIEEGSCAINGRDQNFCGDLIATLKHQVENPSAHPISLSGFTSQSLGDGGASKSK